MDDPSPSRLDDQLDQLVAEFSDAVAQGQHLDLGSFLDRAPQQARPGLERVLKLILSGVSRDARASVPLLPGTRFDQYSLVREIGRGGMACIWLAEDTQLQRSVAIKVLRPGLAAEPRHVDRFRREALAIASLEHPHIIRIHGVGQTGNHHWLAMEYIEGPSLASVVQALPRDRAAGPEDLARATGVTGLAAAQSYEAAVGQLLAPVAEALAHAHEHGIVHRDVKPSNILLRLDGQPVLADFGLAKGDEDPALSLTGEGIGTPYYMSPEQAYLTGKAVDHRTDVYSMGVTLYELLSGQRPFGGDSFLEVVESIRSTMPPALRRVVRGRSKDAEAVVRKAMARLPEERYASAMGLCEDLKAMAADLPTEALRDQGGPIRRLIAFWRMMVRGEVFEYRSATRLLGLPLCHVFVGRRRPGQAARRVKGWFAMGDVATGVFAFGGRATGVFSCGGMATGVVAFGGMALGVVTGAGMSLGVLACGGMCVGWVAFGGLVAGHTAMGGWSYGKYAVGGYPNGTYVITDGHKDPEAVEVFENLFSSWEGFFAHFGL